MTPLLSTGVFLIQVHVTCRHNLRGNIRSVRSHFCFRMSIVAVGSDCSIPSLRRIIPASRAGFLTRESSGFGCLPKRSIDACKASWMPVRVPLDACLSVAL